MSSLTFIQRDDVFTNSLIIANNIRYAHKDITAHIMKNKKRFEKMGGIYYVPSVTNRRGGQFKPIALNEQQAVFLMTLLDNTEIVLDFKMELAIEFVAVRRLLLEKQTQEWQEARQLSKQVRLQETDAIQMLISYAKAQGSKNADKLYMVYSKLVKSLAEYDKRDTANADTLTLIIVFERVLRGVIATEMQLDTHYKAIYQKAKAQLTQLKILWSAPRLSA